MRCIDADELLIKLQWLCDLNCPYTEKQRDVMCSSCLLGTAKDEIESMPTIETEPIEFEWCHDCKEYDNNAHCCHRWTKVIRNTVDDLKTQGYEIVRHGHWEKVTGYYRCSECDQAFPDIGYGFNFCPECGAHMDEVEDTAEPTEPDNEIGYNPYMGCYDFDC